MQEVRIPATELKMDVTNTNILLAYKGPFYIDILSNLGSYVRRLFLSYPLTNIRLYKLFFELTQNVAKYSAESSNLFEYKYSGIGSFSLEEYDNYVMLTTSNLIRNNDGPTLEKYCNEINYMNKTELRDFRSEKRKVQPKAKDTGAHIGIIQIGLLTHNQLEYKIVNYNDDFSVFSISAKVNKE